MYAWLAQGIRKTRWMGLGRSAYYGSPSFDDDNYCKEQYKHSCCWCLLFLNTTFLTHILYCWLILIFWLLPSVFCFLADVSEHLFGSTDPETGTNKVFQKVRHTNTTRCVITPKLELIIQTTEKAWNLDPIFWFRCFKINSSNNEFYVWEMGQSYGLLTC